MIFLHCIYAALTARSHHHSNWLRSAYCLIDSILHAVLLYFVNFFRCMFGIFNSKHQFATMHDTALFVESPFKLLSTVRAFFMPQIDSFETLSTKRWNFSFSDVYLKKITKDLKLFSFMWTSQSKNQIENLQVQKHDNVIHMSHPQW